MVRVIGVIIWNNFRELLVIMEVLYPLVDSFGAESGVALQNEVWRFYPVSFCVWKVRLHVCLRFPGNEIVVLCLE